MDVVQARCTKRHGRLQCMLQVACLYQVAAKCELRPEQFRSSTVLQGVQFDGAYALSLSEGHACLKEVTSAVGAVNQSLHAIADFYEQFYAFRYLCIDPAASDQRQDPPFDFGVYGTDRGGGASPEEAKVNLIQELRTLAASLPPSPGINEWFLPANTIFSRLRDAHVDWRNGGSKADTVLNQFVFILQDDITLRPVQIEVSSTSAVAIDGSADARFVSAGKEIETINGLPAMEWFRVQLLENPAFNYAYKSLGARANRMLKSGRVGFAWLGSHMGDVSSLQPSAQVHFKDGQTTTWTWTWLLLTRSLRSCPKHDANCIINLLKGPLKDAGSLHQSAVEAFGQLHEAHQHELVDVAPLPPDEVMLERLKEDEGLRSLLRIPEEQIPGTQAHTRTMQQTRPSTAAQEEFPRRWLPDPALSPLGSTYGYYQLQRQESGEIFVVLKLSRFYLSEDEYPNLGQIQTQFMDLWKEMVSAAETHHTSKLLVDLSGNPGGFVDFAYLFVRALHPMLPFSAVCNEYDRPVGSLFEAWRQVNTTPLALFLNTTKQAQKRMDNLTPEKQEHLIKILHAVTKACISMDVLSYDDYMLIQSAIDTLDMGEMDAFTLQETVQVLSESAASFGNPFTLYLTAFSSKGNAFDPFRKLRTVRRGGRGALLTEKFRVEDCVSVYTKEFVDALQDVENPFSDILFLSDGLCGSSCDTASRTAYMLSKQLEHGLLTPVGNFPKIRFLTYGGLGGSAEEARRTLSATAYPGGNVMSSAMGLLYNPVFSAAALGYLAATWAGLQQMKEQIDVFRKLVPQYPFFWEELPKYPQSEMYQNALGKEALPSEYYFFPTDLFLPEWYAGVTGSRPKSWNETELKRLHLDAAKGFDWQPAEQLSLRSVASHLVAGFGQRNLHLVVMTWSVGLMLLCTSIITWRRLRDLHLDAMRGDAGTSSESESA